MGIEFIQFEINTIEADRKEQEKKHNDKLDAMVYGLDPFMRAVVRNELCSVKPIIVDVPRGRRSRGVYSGS